MSQDNSVVSRLARTAIILFLLLTLLSFSQVAIADTINGHTVVLDSSGKIIPWTTDPALGYDTVINLAWNYFLNKVPNDPSTGKPAYYSRSYLIPDSQQVADWPHNPAGLYAMLAEGALKYYQYSGNIAPVNLAEAVASWHLAHGMTPASGAWANVPYAEGDAGSLTYQGAAYGNTNGIGDGTGFLEPDKIGELGYAWLTLYQFDGNTAFRDAAITCADVLAAKVRTGDASHSPWPFRVNAQSGAIREEYSSDVIGPIRLFDLLIKLNLGHTANYQTARQTAWTWMMTYPMQNNVWANYFEDTEIQSNLANTTQYTALTTARYLMEHQEYDANWQTHVRGILSWVVANYSTPAYGAKTIGEQAILLYPLGSHTSRYASVNAMLYELTGDATAQQEAIRSFNWATYMARSTGVVIDGPQVNHEWFTDGYGDYIRHFLTGMGAIPTLAPAGQDHLLRSTSIVQNVTYASGDIRYVTFDAAATEVLRIHFVPSSVWAGGVALPLRGDLTQEGWTFDQTTGALRIRHDNSGAIQIVSGGAPVNFPPTVTLTAPAQGSTYQEPANITLTANASDSDGTIARVDFYSGSTLLGTSIAAPFSFPWNYVPAGSYTLTAMATDNLGASTTSAVVTVTVNTPSSLPSPWQTADIGSVGVSGNASYNNGTFTVSGSGTDIAGTADSFRFVYLPLSGNAEIIAQVNAVQNNNSGSLAGVMIRESLNAGAREALVAVTAGNGLTFRRRTSTNGNTTSVNGGSGNTPYFVRLRRQQNTFTAYRSSNGASWTQISQATINMATNIFVGLAVTSHQNTALNTSSFTYVSAGSSVDSTPPVISSVSASTSQGIATINWATNEVSDSQVDYGTTSSYGQSAALNRALVTSHAQAISGLSAGTTYHYRVRSRDASGNLAISGDFTFALASVPDTIPPTAPASLTANASGSAQVDLSWTAATDNVGVVGYQIWRNGVQVGTSLSLNYTDTTVQASTSYTYAVRAYDNAGNLSLDSPSATVTTPAPASITIASVVTAQQGTGGTSITSPAFSTTAANTLLVAFISSDGPSGSAQTITSVTGGGLTWTLRKRVNTQPGSSEIWQAAAPSALSNITITATRGNGSYQGLMTVVAFQGASTTVLGATGGSSATSGAPSASLVTTKAGSLVWGVGDDWDHANTRTVGSGQTKVSEFLAPIDDTYWVQRFTNPLSASGTSATISDTAPTSDRWNLAIIEILAK